MAQIALGIGTSHGPQLSTPPEQWGQRAAADHRNPALAFRGGDYSFAELSELRGAAFAAECEPGVQRERHARSRAAIGELGRTIRAANVDVLVVVSSDHKELYGDELLPQFAIYWGDTMRHEPYTAQQLATMPPGLAVAEVANQPERPEVRHGHSQLGLHLIHEVSRAGFDPGAAKVLPARRVGKPQHPARLGIHPPAGARRPRPDPDRASVRQHVLGAQPADRAPLLRLRRRARRGDRELPR